MKVLYIVRGIPGSGKSTLASKISKEECAAVYEADHFFMMDGKYRFDPKFLKEAHAWCLSVTTRAMYSGYSVIVANTFTKYWELKAYLEAAKKCGFKVHMISCSGEYQNIHGVPDEKVAEMKERFEDGDTIYEQAKNDRFGDILKYE